VSTSAEYCRDCRHLYCVVMLWTGRRSVSPLEIGNLRGITLLEIGSRRLNLRGITLLEIGSRRLNQPPQCCLNFG
jgi:hypothetical protein